MFVEGVLEIGWSVSASPPEGALTGTGASDPSVTIPEPAFSV